MMVAAIGLASAAMTIGRRSARAESPPVTIVLQPAHSRGISAGQARRVASAFRKAAAKRPELAMASRKQAVSATCALDAVCLANLGAKLGASRVVGSAIEHRKGKFILTFVVAQVAPARELARQTVAKRSRRALGKSAAPELQIAVAAAEQAAAAAVRSGRKGGGDAAEDAAALSVSAPGPTTADGRSIAEVVVEGGPGPVPGELAKRPQLPTLECDRAPALPASPERAPAVMVPAVRKAVSLECVARLRDAEVAFALPVVPPTTPGLYAGYNASRVRATDEKIPLEAFVVDKSGSRGRPSSIRAATSAGSLEFGDDGALALLLPGRHAPRAIAIAMTDGLHVGAAFLPVWGVTDLDVRAERRSEVSIRIAGRWWGPKENRTGLVRLPIEVPPGVESGVVRAVRSDAAVESVANLHAPRLSRIAAVGFSDEVPAGGATRILAAVADADGRPAPDDTRVYARARKGAVADARPLGGGLWEIQYRAPDVPARDRVVVRVKGDRYAGRATVKIETVPGAAKMVHVSVPDRIFHPGDEIHGAVFIRDSTGNLLDGGDVAATLAGQPVVLTPGVVGSSFRVVVPERLPIDGPLALRVTTGGLTVDRALPVAPGEPNSGALALSADGRTGTARVEVRDRFGNLLPARQFEVTASGASSGPLRRVGDRYEMQLRAREEQRSAAVEVRAGGRVLARQTVRFGPGRDALFLGAWTEGGWVASQGDFSAPRGALGIGLRRFVGPIELGLGVGAEAFTFEDSPSAAVGVQTRQFTRRLVGMAVPARLRGRLPLSERFGLSLDMALVPTRVRIALESDFQTDDAYTETVLGARGQLAFDWLMGSARGRVGVSYGSAALSDGPVTGEIEGLGVVAGVEWWFADFEL